ncbi:hypothetical protein ACFLV3_06160 [Chloroflexota bacterium]
MEAATIEFHSIQAAVAAMMVDNNLSSIPNPVAFAIGVAHNDMTWVDDTTDRGFPDYTTTAVDKGYNGGGDPQPGYVLYQHDRIDPSDTTNYSTVNYVNISQTTYYYTCETDGTVRQWDDAAMTTEYTYGITNLAPAPTPTPTPTHSPEVPQQKVKDIESIMNEAENIGIHVSVITHEGSGVTFSFQADSYTSFRDFLTALGESGRFSTPIPSPPEGSPFTKSGTIKLTPKFQYIDMPTVYYEADQALHPITTKAALDILVYIAKESGIDLDPSAGYLRIPTPDSPIEVKTEQGGTLFYYSINNIVVQGDYDSVMAFITDLDSGKTLKTMVLTRLDLKLTELDGKIEAIAPLNVDIYYKP